jgi:acetylornithine deacetylase/succinyl-diaminopimelate desuccinylase-like protein
MHSQTPLEHAREQRASFLASVIDLLRIPSISTLPEHKSDMQRAAAWLRDRLQSIGLRAEIISGDGHPLVYAEWLEATAAPTLVLYGHYDVQPVDPRELWTTPPFEPDVREGNLFARGAADDKGQTMTMVLAAESFMRTGGRLPINVKFLIEGEEEAGGAAIEKYVTEHGDRLRADAMQVADSSMFAPGVPTIEAGLRGIVYVEVRARGAAHDLHSGLYGGVAPNPFNALAHIIAGLKGVDGTITIPGFYDDVRIPDQAVLESWRELPFDEEALRRDEIGCSELVGEPGFTPLERMWSRPTLDVHGIPGGFIEQGAKTVIPAEATAKISMRLVPDQKAETIRSLYRRRVEELTPPGIQTTVIPLHATDPVLIPTDNAVVSAAREALAQTFGRPAVLGRSGGSIPIVGFVKEKLGLDSILMGWGLPDDNLHAPNEKLSLDNFYRGIEATIRFWQILGSP